MIYESVISDIQFLLFLASFPTSSFSLPETPSPLISHMLLPPLLPVLPPFLSSFFPCFFFFSHLYFLSSPFNCDMANKHTGLCSAWPGSQWTNLDAWNDTQPLDELHEGPAIISLLVQCLVEEDHAGDVVPEFLERASSYLRV